MLFATTVAVLEGTPPAVVHCFHEWRPAGEHLPALVPVGSPAVRCLCMSCRVLHRGVEEALLAKLAAEQREAAERSSEANAWGEN